MRKIFTSVVALTSLTLTPLPVEAREYKHDNTVQILSIIEQIVRDAEYTRRMNRQYRGNEYYDPRKTEPYCYYDVMYDFRGKPHRVWICR